MLTREQFAKIVAYGVRIELETDVVPMVSRPPKSSEFNLTKENIEKHKNK